MGSIGNPRDYLIITNNPLVVACMEGKILGTIEFHEGVSYRDILVMVRDKVYAGHTLYTHPLAGSVKPNETPYKSVVVSVEPHGFDAMESEIISNAIGVCDKFKPSGGSLPSVTTRTSNSLTIPCCPVQLTSMPRRVLVIKNNFQERGGVHFETGTGIHPDQ